MVQTSDERNAPSIDMLDEHGRTLFFEMLLNDRRPVAIVGSGMSIVYGGVTWYESVKLALDYAVERIKACQEVPQFSAKRAEMERDRVALSTFHEDNALDSSAHKYVALDLCEVALNRIDRLDEEYWPECPIIGK